MTTTYRYVSDGSLVDGMHRDGLARLLKPWVVGTFVVGILGLGIALALVTYRASLPTYLGKVLLIGLLWGALELVLVLVGVAVMIPALRAVSRRVLARNYAPGLVTEVELADETLVVRRPAGTRTIPYARLAQVRRRRVFLTLAERGSLRPVLLPPDLLPEEALDHLRTRRLGRVPAVSAPLPTGRPTATFVAPPGWSAHLAAVHTRATLTSGGFLVRCVLGAVVSVVLALLWTPAALLAAPGMVLLFLVVTYTQARQAFESAVPDGSTATTEALDDGLVSRNHGGVRVVRYDDVRSVDVRGDVVLLGLRSTPGRLLVARALVPDQVLDRMRGLTPPAGG